MSCTCEVSHVGLSACPGLFGSPIAVEDVNGPVLSLGPMLLEVGLELRATSSPGILLGGFEQLLLPYQLLEEAVQVVIFVLVCLGVFPSAPVVHGG